MVTSSDSQKMEDLLICTCPKIVNPSKALPWSGHQCNCWERVSFGGTRRGGLGGMWFLVISRYSKQDVTGRQYSRLKYLSHVFGSWDHDELHCVLVVFTTRLQRRLQAAAAVDANMFSSRLRFLSLYQHRPQAGQRGTRERHSETRYLLQDFVEDTVGCCQRCWKIIAGTCSCFEGNCETQQELALLFLMYMRLTDAWSISCMPFFEAKPYR